nr:glycosyltransferase family 4 protein [Photobacterium leiognathi]
MIVKKVVFIINVDWYFKLHWLERAIFLKNNGYDISLITNFTSSEIKDNLIKLGITCYQCQIKRKSINPVSELNTIFQIQKILSIIDPDIIHAITVKPNLYAGLNNIFLGKKIIYSITGLGAVFSSSRIRFKIIKNLVIYIYRLISNNKSIFIFENDSDFRIFKDEGVLIDNGVVIHGAGVDTEKYFYKKPNYNRNILFASRLLKDKGLDTLLDALEILKKKDIRCILNVAGIIDSDVTSAIPIKDLLELEKANKIKWIGTEKDMVSLIHKNDIVCLPTRYGEGIPRILIEAASCGRAIIGTDVSGCNDIIDNNYNGFLVPINNAKDLADKLIFLLENSNLLREFGANGRCKVLRQFDQNIVLEKTISIYKRLIDINNE